MKQLHWIGTKPVSSQDSRKQGKKWESPLPDQGTGFALEAGNDIFIQNQHAHPPLRTGVFNNRVVCTTYSRSKFWLKSNFPLSCSWRFHGTYLKCRVRAVEVKGWEGHCICEAQKKPYALPLLVTDPEITTCTHYKCPFTCYLCLSFTFLTSPYFVALFSCTLQYLSFSRSSNVVSL